MGRKKPAAVKMGRAAASLALWKDPEVEKEKVKERGGGEGGERERTLFVTGPREGGRKKKGGEHFPAPTHSAPHLPLPLLSAHTVIVHQEGERKEGGRERSRDDDHREDEATHSQVAAQRERTDARKEALV